MWRARALMGLAVLCVSTVTAAAQPPVSEPDGYWTGPVNDPVPSTLKGAKVIHTAELAQLIRRQGGSAVIVDVSNAPRRPENLPDTTQWLPVPHRALPGAVWIPGAGLGDIPASIDAFFRKRLAEVSGADLHRTLVVYCHERCWLSWNAARRAVQYGYRNVYWYPDGIEGWRAARQPTAIIEPETPPEARGGAPPAPAASRN
jgi:PQQ-dependent catabolism-associated CXXCW motif protein